MRFHALIVATALVLWGAQSAEAADKPDCSQFKINAKASTTLGDGQAVSANCHTRIKDGYPVPDPKCTPGAANPTLTISVLKNSDFRTGCVRDNATTASQKASTYAAYSTPHPKNNKGAMQKCELDHLVSLELGGADTLDNIWPQCGPNSVALRNRYFKQKDMVENYLAMRVRNGEIDLDDAQHGIASDWTQYLDDAKEACKAGKCK